MNKRYYIAPSSTMSKALYESLRNKNDGEFLGYIDSSKEGEGIYKIDDVSSKDYDYIYIVSPNHGIVIDKYLCSKGLKRSKIKHFEYKSEEFEEVSYLSLFIHNKKRKLSLYLQKKLHDYKHVFEKNNHILLLAPEFIDINIKALYLYISNHTNFKVSIATSNEKQCKVFQKNGFDVVTYPSFSFLIKSLFSKYKILDHSPIHDEILISLTNSFTVQIWHGITIKKLGHMANYKKVKYDLMVSTSDFVTEYSFSKLFDYKSIINSGYPRNDILVNGVLDDRDLVMAHKGIYEFVKSCDKRVVVYMPTWRPYSHIKNPIDLDDLNDFAKENGFIFIIKSHPFTRNDSFYDSTFDETKYKFSEKYQENVLFYPTTDDIYPLLSLSDLLITDYSSIYFDYLLINKPILFFIYDKDIYLVEHGDFMLSFEEYTPGEKVENYVQLKNIILESFSDKKFKKSRDNIKKIFFDILDGNSSKLITDSIINKNNIN
ncbi:MAG: CDP-glycerol glycerophosphotransferase family protein [Arcobacter sp.]|uniref:CDP-glycerol glycerophosphotransferase family protein n=1 Tax=Arcobacter sp. TaxID=1872629 RepID=UPI003B004047